MLSFRKLAGACAVTALVVTGASALPAAAEGSHGWGYGGKTTVSLDAGTVTAVVGLGLTPSAVAPGTLDGLTATFPIVGPIKNGIVRHAGGLKLSTAGKGWKKKVLELTDYNINENTGKLTSEAEFNGKDLGRIPLFDLSNVKTGQPGCAVTADLKLDMVAAGALTAKFGAPDLTGTFFGSACVAPKAKASHPDRDERGHWGDRY